MSDDKLKYFFRSYIKHPDGRLGPPIVPIGEPHEIGKRAVAPEEPYFTDIKGEDTSILYNGRVHPVKYGGDNHYGFSMLGKIMPNVSIWENGYPIPRDTLSGDELEAYNKDIDALVPESFKDRHELAKYYIDGETNDYEYLTNRYYPVSERLHGLKHAGVIPDTPGLVSLSKGSLDFDSDQAWDDLVEDTAGYNNFREEDGEDGGIFLVGAPEDKILDVGTTIEKGYDVQRDSPNEIVSTEIIPVKEIPNYSEAAEKYKGLRGKGASGMDAFYDTFKLEPGEIGSDENIKYIYKDMSNAYNAMCDRKSILDGLTQGGRRWL